MKEQLLKELADRLIETLGVMDSKEADAVVRDVVTTIYNDVLGIKGYIKGGNTKMILCGSFGSQVLHGEYEFVELKEKGSE